MSIADNKVTKIDEIEKRTIRKAAIRLVPFLILAYLLCYIDRINLGFAALTMNKELGFTATIFGWGAGIMFISYFLCGVPSNLALHKLGARRWIGTLMITWGILSASMALTRDVTSFLCLRFLLGMAESGFFPGVVLYLTYWFPDKHRAVIGSRFMFAQPIALMIGSAVSGWILNMDGIAGIAGWKWLFILEGIPSSIVGVIAIFYLTDKPSQAKWLTAEERTWLQSAMDSEKTRAEVAGKVSARGGMLNGRVILLSILYLTIVTGIYGVGMWTPQIVKAFGHLSSSEIGLITAFPFLLAAIGMLAIGSSSDRTGERKWHLTLAVLGAGFGLLGSAVFSDQPIVVVFCLAIAATGLYGCMSIFWLIPPTFLTGAAAAVGIATINSVGNLGGFAGPFVVGWIKDTTGDFIYGLVYLGTLVVIGGVLAYIISSKNEAEKKPYNVLAPQ